TFTDNVLYNNPGGLGRITAIHASGNITANPQYTNPASHAYQVPTTSPAARLHLWDGRLGQRAVAGGG
ncbi:MAG: hypothetical protein ACRDPM_26525, partial [Solirubrobacteraceae bacterium]